jgi:hypothetical protein
MDDSSLHDRAAEFAKRWMQGASPQMRRIFEQQLEELLRQVNDPARPSRAA